jgi:hypothetical protein
VRIDRLAGSELLLFALLALHTVDHAVNQPARELPAGSGAIGILGLALVAAAIVAALFHVRHASLIGFLAGAGTLAGFAIVHLPGFGPLADPYTDFSANALSWILLFAPMAAAAWVTWISATEMRDERGPQRPLPPAKV